LDGSPGHQYRIEIGLRGELAGLADLPLDVAKHGDCLLGSVLVSDTPAREAARKAECPLQIEAVDLHHHPINAIGEPRSGRFELVEYGFDVGDIGDDANKWTRGDSELACLVKQVVLGSDVPANDLAAAMGDEFELARGDGLGIEPL